MTRLPRVSSAQEAKARGWGRVGLAQICYAFDSCLRLLVGAGGNWMRMRGQSRRHKVAIQAIKTTCSL